MYNSGDELGAIVCDIGNYAARIGYAGEDFPKAYMPSSIGVLSSKDSNATASLHYNIHHFQENLEIQSMMKDGLISNFDYFEKFLTHVLDTTFKCQSSETPFLMTEKSYNPQSLRHQTCELMFESFQLPGYFLAKDSVLECYSCGRTSGVVIDVGGSGTNISPVNDGFVELKGLNQSPISTKVMDAYMLQLIQSKMSSGTELPGVTTHSFGNNNSPIMPAYRIQKNNIYADGGPDGPSVIVPDPMKPLFEIKKLNNVHPTYDDYFNLELGRQIKESVCRLAEGSLTELYARYNMIPSTLFELPDGRTVDAGIERYMVHELLFDPTQMPVHLYQTPTPYIKNSYSIPLSSVTGPTASTTNSATGATDSSSSSNMDIPISASTELELSTTQVPVDVAVATLKSIPQLVIDSVVRCDQDLHSSLLSNIVIAGGGSCVVGLPDRMRYEIELLTRTIAPNWRIKTMASNESDRAIAAWLGGSIVGSLGSFHEMWISKKEYDEFGPAIIDKKCP